MSRVAKGCREESSDGPTPASDGLDDRPLGEVRAEHMNGRVGNMFLSISGETGGLGVSWLLQAS